MSTVEAGHGRDEREPQRQRLPGDPDGESRFGIFVARDAQRELVPEQVAASEPGRDRPAAEAP